MVNNLKKASDQKTLTEDNVRKLEALIIEDIKSQINAAAASGLFHIETFIDKNYIQYVKDNKVEFTTLGYSVKFIKSPWYPNNSEDNVIRIEWK